MDATSSTIIGTGIAIIIANAGMFAWLRGDLAKLAGRVDSLSERMARMEGKTDLLLQGLQIRIEPKPPGTRPAPISHGSPRKPTSTRSFLPSWLLMPGSRSARSS